MPAQAVATMQPAAREMEEAEVVKKWRPIKLTASKRMMILANHLTTGPDRPIPSMPIITNTNNHWRIITTLEGIFRWMSSSSIENGKTKSESEL